MHFHPLLAAGWLEALAPLLVAVFWALRAFLEARGQKAARGPEPDILEKAEPIPRDRGDAGRAPAGKPQQPVREGPARNGPVRNEIEDFLKRLADESPANEPESPVQSPVEPAPPKRLEPVEARQPAAAAESPPGGATVGEHVRQHLGRLEESQLAEEASRLGTGVAQRDDKVAARLKQKFDHRLGDLEGRGEEPSPTEPASKDPTPAESLAKMLASPTGIRDAVLLNEILNRPSDRW